MLPTRLALILGLTLFCPVPEPPPSPRVVLVVVADDLGWGSLGDAFTPNVDALQSSGVTFDAFYVQPICAPSRRKLLTGVRHRGTNVWAQGQQGIPDWENPPLPWQSFTILEAAKSAGYSTFFSGKWGASNQITGLLDDAARAHGADEAAAVSAFGVGPGYGGGTAGHPSWTSYDNGVRSPDTTYNTTAITDATLGHLASSSTNGEGVLLWVSYNAPHAPFHVPPNSSLPPGYVVDQGAPGIDVRDQYLAMVASMDFELGRLVSALDMSESLVVFLSDNGTPEYPGIFGTGEVSGQVKGSMYDGGVRCPAVVAGAGVGQGTCKALIDGIDLWATLADRMGYSGVRPPESLSFSKQLEHPDAPHPRRYVACSVRKPNAGTPTFYNRMIRDGAYKLIVEDPDGDGPNVETLTLLDAQEQPTVDAGAQAALLAELAALGY